MVDACNKEISQESTGFSLNKLVLGDTVRGPLVVLSDDLKNVAPSDYVLNYVNDFCHCLHIACVTAQKSSVFHKKKMKQFFFNHKTETCLFEPGDQVLDLFPAVGSPFQTKFSGPYTIKSHVRQGLLGTYSIQKEESSVVSCKLIKTLPCCSLCL